MNAADEVFAQNSRVAYRDLAEDEGGVLLHLDTGQYHGINSLGVLIWRLLDGAPRTAPAIVAELAGRVEAPPDVLQRDVSRFLAELRERDLVVG